MASEDQHVPDRSDSDEDHPAAPSELPPITYDDDTSTMLRVLNGLKDTA